MMQQLQCLSLTVVRSEVCVYVFEQGRERSIA